VAFPGLWIDLILHLILPPQKHRVALKPSCNPPLTGLWPSEVAVTAAAPFRVASMTQLECPAGSSAEPPVRTSSCFRHFAIEWLFVMSWLDLQRIPEPEVMDSQDEVLAYSSAAGQKHLDVLDSIFVDQLVSLGPAEGLLLDVGCGPGNIVLKVARRCPRLSIVALDYSANMVRAGRRAAGELGLENQVFFNQGSADQIPFANSTFDIVISNSVLHHLKNPSQAFEEMLRVAKPDGPVLVRDLRRPSRLAFPWHVCWHGRHYSGIMKRLFGDSVRAAYTPDELARLLCRSGMSRARIFLHERTHMGFVYRGQHS
jgi:SAM-dependent methyltransferase